MSYFPHYFITVENADQMKKETIFKDEQQYAWLYGRQCTKPSISLQRFIFFQSCAQIKKGTIFKDEQQYAWVNGR